MLFCTCFCTFCRISVHLSIICVYSPFCCGANVTWRPDVLRSVVLWMRKIPFLVTNKVIWIHFYWIDAANSFAKHTYLWWFWWASIVSSSQHSPIPSTFLAFDYPIHSTILRCFWVFGAVALRNSLCPSIAILYWISIANSLKKKTNLYVKIDSKRHERHDSIVSIHLQSALAKSLSLHGTSSVKLLLAGFPLVVTFGTPLRLYSTPEMPRGRGGTAGLVFVILWVFVWASSELESSWPPLETDTKQTKNTRHIQF